MTNASHTQLFHVTYYGQDDRPMSTGTIEAEDYWDACTRLLGTMPPGAVDFDVEDLEGIALNRLDAA